MNAVTNPLVKITAVGLLLASLVSGAAALTRPVLAAGVLYAAPTALGSGDCSSWSDACTLQAALALSASGDQIWVQAGVHRPGTDRMDAFELRSGVELYGGFTGSESDLSERNWQTHLTVLSGDIGADDLVDANGVVTDTFQIAGGNAYNVVRARAGVTQTARLDGFIVTAGQANGIGDDISGGGMWNETASPTIANVTFIGNEAFYGGGMRNTLSGNPTLTHVVFISNTAVYGGGMDNNHSTPTLMDVVFSSNTGSYGGGMYNSTGSPILASVTFIDNVANYGGGMTSHWYSHPTLADVVFSGNTAVYSGGGMRNTSYSNPTLNRVAFINNAADEGGGVYSYLHCSPSLTNVAFSGNTAGQTGGGMHNVSHVSPTLSNVTISGNLAGLGGGVYNCPTCNPTLVNSVVWGNSATDGPQIFNAGAVPVIAYSLVQGSGGSGSGWDTALGQDGGGNLDANPLFASAHDLHLLPGSPAIDAGNNSLVPVGVTQDLDGGPRFVDVPSVPDSGAGTRPLVDMGAYEARFVVLTKMVSPSVIGPQGVITFTIGITNTGALTASRVVITDTLPAFMQTNSVVTSGIAITDTGHVPRHVWTAQDLAPGATGALTLTTAVSSPVASGFYTNTAVVSFAVGAGTAAYTDSVRFTVLAQAPLFTSTPATTTLEDRPYRYDVTTTDEDTVYGDSLTITAPTLPHWLTLNDNGDGTATLNGTPGSADIGALTVELRVTDSVQLSATQQFEIDVAPSWFLYLPLIFGGAE